MSLNIFLVIIILILNFATVDVSDRIKNILNEEEYNKNKQHIYNKYEQRLEGRYDDCCKITYVYGNNITHTTSIWNSYFYNCSQYHITEVPSLVSELIIRKYTGYDVDCSHCSLDLVPTEIPGVPSDEIIRLNLSGNYVERLPSKVFANFTSLVSLNLSNNLVMVICEDAFFGLTNLEVLQMGGINNGSNEITIIQPDAVFSMLLKLSALDISNYYRQGFLFDELMLALCSVKSPLEVLIMNRIHGSVFVPWILNKSFYRCINQINLKVLSMEQNAITGITDISDLKLYQLRWISVRRNCIVPYFTTKFALIEMSLLTCFDMGCQKIASDWIDCTPENTSSLTTSTWNKKHSGYPENNSTCPKGSIPSIQMFRNLRYVRLDYWDIGVYIDFHNFKFCLVNNVIEHLDFSYTKVFGLHGTAWCMHNLTYVSLRGIKAQFLDSKILCQAPKLKVLILKNSATPVNFEHHGASSMFKQSPQLTHIDLSYNGIKTIQNEMFQWSKHLEYLDLSHNQLLHINLESKNLTSLKTLDLSWNQLHGLNIRFALQLDGLAKNQNLTLHLENNPLMCTCVVREYLKIIYFSKIHIPGYDKRNGTVCVFENGTSLPVKHATELLLFECMVDYKTVFILYSVVVLLEFIIALIGR